MKSYHFVCRARRVGQALLLVGLAALACAPTWSSAQVASSAPGWVVIPVEEYRTLRAKAYPIEPEPDPLPAPESAAPPEPRLRTNSNPNAEPAWHQPRSESSPRRSAPGRALRAGRKRCRVNCTSPRGTAPSFTSYAGGASPCWRTLRLGGSASSNPTRTPNIVREGRAATGKWGGRAPSRSSDV